MNKHPEPKKTLCSVCNDKKGKLTGEYCADNELHPTYKERYDPWDNLTYLDCWAYIRCNETKEEHEERMAEREKKRAS
tara:strand:+ start:285 stop:518 length:234 start_codon:yes stop_codon:yes gene_type:complete